MLRNYWMYEGETGKTFSPSRAALAQGLWPRFPGLPGASAVRLNTPVPSSQSYPRYTVQPISAQNVRPEPVSVASAN